MEEKSFIEEFPDTLIAEMKMPWEEEIAKDIKAQDGKAGGKSKPPLDLDKALETQTQEFIENTGDDTEQIEDVNTGGKAPGAKESEETPLEETETDSSSSAVNNLYKLFAKANHERGVLPQFSEEEYEKLLTEKKDPVEVLIHLNKEAIKAEVDQYKAQLPQTIKTLIDNYEEGVPLMEMLKSQDMQQRYDSITQKHVEEQPELAKALIVRDAMSKGSTQEEALELYTEYQEAGIDDKMALRSLASLKKFESDRIAKLQETARNEAQQAETKRIEKLESFKKFISSTNEIIPGVTVTDADKATIAKILTEPVEYVESGQSKRPISALEKIRGKNPMAFDRTLAYLYHLGVFNLDAKNEPTPDWSKVIKKAKSTTIKELETTLQSAGDDILKFAGTGKQQKPDAPDDNFFETFTVLTKGPGK